MENKSTLFDQPLPPIKQLLKNENTNSVSLLKFCYEENIPGYTKQKKTETRNFFNNHVTISCPQKEAEQYQENPTLKPLKIKKPEINTGNVKAIPKQQKWVFEENIFQKRGRKGKQSDWKINIKKISGENKK
jgi:hypothetical protein